MAFGGLGEKKEHDVSKKRCNGNGFKYVPLHVEFAGYRLGLGYRTVFTV